MPLVLLHGVADSWRSYERVLEHLPASLRAIALTQRGHGDADRPESGYRYRDFAADLAGFMEAKGLRSAVVVGHSMGAAVAQRFAIDHPTRIRGLVLVGAFESLCRNDGVRELWQTTVSKLEDPVDEGFVREFQASTLARPVPPGFFETVVAESLKVPARVWRETFRGFAEEDHSADLHRIVAPTLVVWGDQDAFCPRSDQDALTAAIAGSRLVVVPGAGHGVHWEEPERVAACIADFVGSIPG
jgi:pimeloyl-ACP methyl ester carboxylesterase